MCIHETIQLSQDGERVIVCGDCGREFAKIADDNEETLVVPMGEGDRVVLLHGSLEAAERASVMTYRSGVLTPQPIYPCARCGFSSSCPKVEGESCHT